MSDVNKKKIYVKQKFKNNRKKNAIFIKPLLLLNVTLLQNFTEMFIMEYLVYGV